MKHDMKRKGFTLVELLIVIVVIGILSAMMMMSSTEATTSAKASNVVSNLRNLKTAALALYTDNLDSYSSKDAKAPEKKLVFAYLNSGQQIPESKDYDLVGAEGATVEAKGKGSWYLKYTLAGTASEKARIASKLAGRAQSVGLLKNESGTFSKYEGGDEVYMKVR